MLCWGDISFITETMSQMSVIGNFFMIKKPVGTEQEDGYIDLSLQQCFISIARPTWVFIYFCPSSGVNKTLHCQRGAWVMRLVSLKALHPTGHGSTSETQGKWIWCLRNLFILHFYAYLCVCVFVLSCNIIHGHQYHHAKTFQKT